MMRVVLALALLPLLSFPATAGNIILTNLKLAGVFQAAGQQQLSDGGPLSPDPAVAPIFAVAPFVAQILEVNFTDAITNELIAFGPIFGTDIFPGNIDGTLSWIDPLSSALISQFVGNPVDNFCCAFAGFIQPPDLSKPVLFSLTVHLNANHSTGGQASEDATGYFSLGPTPEPSTWTLMGVGLVGFLLLWARQRSNAQKHLKRSTNFCRQAAV
jgi:hypothetical protein